MKELQIIIKPENPYKIYTNSYQKYKYHNINAVYDLECAISHKINLSKRL